MKEKNKDKKHLTIKDMPKSERPYEKCERYGASYLSNAELLAVIIRTGTRNSKSIDLAMEVLNLSKTYPGLKGLNYLTMNELMQVSGIGKVKAIELLCVAELTKRMAKEMHTEALKLVSPKSVANYYMQDMRHLTQEKILLIMFDTKNRVIKDKFVSHGTVNSTIMPVREIFICALKYEAVNIIVIHNHPSGDPSPSAEDIRVTRRLYEAGSLIGISLLDHIIIGDNKYVSLKEQGTF